jgi:tetratricopeptide (TPR) repeat protein
MTLQTAPAPQTIPDVATVETTARGWSWTRTLMLLGGLFVVLLGSYALAWWSAYRLSMAYLGDADASYDAGEFVNALVGHEEFDRARNDYVEYGGYMQIERIWTDQYAVPVPPEVQRARQRIDEIVNSRLTIEEAEKFVQENAGRGNPYLGLIYFRLGELYQADGRLLDAEDIFTSFADLFPQETALIERAQHNLEALQNVDSGD